VPVLTRHRGGSGPPLVAIDLPGFGESPPLRDGAAPTPTRLADAVESELDRLGLVRVAYGTLDLMLGVFTAPRFAAAIPGAELVPLPALGHVPMLDDPDLVARTILDFTIHALNQHDEPPARFAATS
jgi:pimeloyl-ACP methyl ester carboxylesterase